MPSPSRPLSKVMPCKAIKAANKEINKVVKSMKWAMEHTCGSNGSVSTTQAAATQALQGPYVRFTVEEKA